jgi:hypothetical protein
VSGIPHSVLVDASGKVVYEGGPQGVSPDLVQKATAGALKKPLWELPKAFAKVRAAIAKGDLATALKEAEAVKAQQGAPEEAAALVDSVKAMIAGGVAGADAMAAAGDYLGAQSEYQRVAKAAKGLPEEQQAKEKLAALAKDPAAKKGIKAQKELEKLTAEAPRSKKDVEELKTALEAFIKKNEGSFAAKRAQDLVAKYEKS